jgi:hypothetical protein
LIKRWALQNPDPGYADMPRGRPEPYMSDAECRKCIAELRKGYWESDRHWHFATLRHAANNKQECPTIAECIKRYSPNTEDGMWRRLRRYDPNLIHITTPVKHVLTPAQMEARLGVARFYSRQNLSYFHRIFQVDAKSMRFCPTTGYAIGYVGDTNHSVQMEPATYYNHEAHKLEIVTAKFYAMANFHAGVCGFHVCQGTTGFKPKYMVR